VRSKLAIFLVALAAAGLASASSTTVTISVRPAVVPYGQNPELFGTVRSGKPGELVRVQFKQCGLYPLQFRDVTTARVGTGGTWSAGIGSMLTASGTFRALWREEVSREMALMMRAFVDLRRHPSRGFTVRVAGTQSFWRKPVRVERFDFRARKWVLVRTLLLTESESAGDAGAPIAETLPFRPRVPKGTTLRAVLPLAAAKPCYLAGYSTLQRA
jgi:hypothetical protein